MLFKVLSALCAALVSPAYAQTPQLLPVNPAITQGNILDTICQVGWTKTVRPSWSVTNRIKVTKLRERGLAEADKSRFELDHIIPLALGGATADPDNLQLEPWPEALEKHKIEVCLSVAVCTGKISLADAQEQIFDDWRKAGDICMSRSPPVLNSQN